MAKRGRPRKTVSVGMQTDADFDDQFEGGASMSLPTVPSDLNSSDGMAPSPLEVRGEAFALISKEVSCGKQKATDEITVVVESTNLAGKDAAPEADKTSGADETEEILKPQESVQRKSYLDAVQMNRDSSKGWSLKYTPLEVNSHEVYISKEEWEAGSSCWNTTLVGRILGKRITFTEMSAFVKSQWDMFEVPKVHVRTNGVCLFTFASKEKMDMIMSKRWTFYGLPLILKPWSDEMDLENMDVSRVPVWVRLPNLHFSLWNKESLGKIASYIGVPLATDKLTSAKVRLDYARILVDVSISDLVPETVQVRTEKGLISQAVEFEWLPVQCGRCKGYGHPSAKCRAPEKKERQIYREKQGTVPAAQTIPHARSENAKEDEGVDRNQQQKGSKGRGLQGQPKVVWNARSPNVQENMQDNVSAHVSSPTLIPGSVAIPTAIEPGGSSCVLEKVKLDTKDKTKDQQPSQSAGGGNPLPTSDNG